ncbi:MAG: glycosyltransferase family 1 protein [Cypionkella sp.]|nr:glycosyltransferase family 1 protein [Cypionkella sp.]
MARIPHGITAPLGVTLAAPAPSPITPRPPYFVALGTIEPRKNHRLLFDIWAQMGQGAPQLIVIGGKGWADAALFDQMAQLQRTGAVIHAENLPDGAVVTLLQGASALLFPSLAEGFGLPPIEAAALGTPVIASDLPVLRETCGQFAVYLSPSDVYSWMETIKNLARHRTARQEQKVRRDLPLWADHFKTVLTQIG